MITKAKRIWLCTGQGLAMSLKGGDMEEKTKAEREKQTKKNRDTFSNVLHIFTNHTHTHLHIHTYMHTPTHTQRAEFLWR